MQNPPTRALRVIPNVLIGSRNVPLLRLTIGITRRGGEHVTFLLERAVNPLWLNVTASPAVPCAKTEPTP